MAEKNTCRARFRFYNRDTGVAAETYISKDNDEVREANRESLLACEHAVTEDILTKDLSLLPYDAYMLWIIPGNAVKSYDKRIARCGDVEVSVRLVA